MPSSGEHQMRNAVLLKAAFLLFAFAFFMSSIAVAAPVIVWKEDFQSHAVGTTHGSAPDLNGMDINWGTWTGHRADWFEVKENTETKNRYMEARDLDGRGYWVTDRISILGYTDVGISMEIAEEGNQNWTDYMLMYYAVTDNITDERYWNLFSYRFNDFRRATAEISGLSGNYLSIGIVIRNNSNDELHRFDNVMVTAGTVPIPGSILLLGSGLVWFTGIRRKKGNLNP